jgi:hypothetical protein
VLFGCNKKSDQGNAGNEGTMINLFSSPPDKEPLVKDFFPSIRYLPLETTAESLVGSKYSIQQIDNYILVSMYKDCLLFDAENGKFIRKIGHVGNDPEGYSSATLFYNPYNQTLYFQGWHLDLVKYSLDGKFLGKIKIPLQDNSLSTPSVAYPIAALDEQTLCAFFPNINGKETKKLMLFSETEDIRKMYLNIHLIDTRKMATSTNDGIFYQYNRGLYFKETFVDTVYRVSENNLTPHYIIDFSKHYVTYEDRYDHLFESTSLNVVMENDHYFLFSFSKFNLAGAYLGIYDKKKEQTEFYQYDDGFEDNINHFLPIKPTFASDDGTLIGALEASDVYDWFLDKNNIPNQSIASLSNVLSDDNPIVVFVK